MSGFFFAWVDGTESTFVAATHARYDEPVFDLVISQDEGEFASATVTVRLPSTGLLNPARKFYCWISATHNSVITALFFGRLVGFPKKLAGQLVELEFIAQFPGWEAARDAVVAANQSLPFYDVAFLSAEQQRDPQSILEGQTKLFHYHRTTGAVTLSDILTGGTAIALSPLPGEGVRVDITRNPARRVNVYATVEWEQQIRGRSFDVQRRIRDAFGGTVNSLTPEAIEQDWPSVGDSVGGDSGYMVTRARIRRIGTDALPSTMTPVSNQFFAKVDEDAQPIALAATGRYVERRIATVTRTWFEIKLYVDYFYRQRRRELIEFTVLNDVQALAFGTTDQIDISIDLQAEDVVGLGLIPANSSSYFRTARGKLSFHHLLARAKAALANSARAIELTVSVDFWSVLDISLDHQATVTAPTIPGGTATGKVIGYALRVDSSGNLSAEVALGVSVGNGASYTASGVDTDYCDTTVFESDIQTESGEENGGTGLEDMIYETYADQIETIPDTQRKVLSGLIVDTVTITNSPTEQQATLLSQQYPTRDNPDSVLSSVPTQIDVTMIPLTASDELEHTIGVVMAQPYAAPQGIDLAS